MALIALLTTAVSAFAQDPEVVDPADTARFHFGPIHLTPAIALSNMGVDSNVFNESIDEKSDTTGAFGPAANIWMRLGRARLSAHTEGQYLYFAKYTNQRAWNTNDTLRLDLPLNRFSPFVFGGYVNTRDRPGYEIDSRARRVDRNINLGTDVRLSGRTLLTIAAGRVRMAFDKDETFLGASLAAALDRTTTGEQMTLRYELTPLTTLVVGAEGMQDRFDVSNQRDADSVKVVSGFEFKPSALVSGTISLGVRHFNALDESTPDFDGFVGAVKARYLVGRSRVEGQYSRDLAFSFEPTRPYYALNAWTLSLTERLAKSWDLVGRVGRETLAYRSFAGSTLAPRTDHGEMFGGGVGYLLGDTVRIGFDLNYYVRSVPVITSRDFAGLRAGASISYGFTQ